jgi:hypothetical protein
VERVPGSAGACARFCGGDKLTLQQEETEEGALSNGV